MSEITFKERDFVHLRLHTDYSLLQSTVQLKPLGNRLQELNLKACAITDLGNLYGAISFYNVAKSAEFKPILGYEAFVANGSRTDRSMIVKTGERPYYNLVLLAENQKGFENLVHLSSKAFTEGLATKPRIDMEILREHCEGLIALSSDFHGAIWHFIRNNKPEIAAEFAAEYKSIFGEGNFFIEIQEHGLQAERDITPRLLEFAKEQSIPLVATNKVHYLNEDDSDAHDVLLCIGDGKTMVDATRTTLGSSKFYLRSADEMWKIFGDIAPEALTNTISIAKRCNIKFDLGKNFFLPTFPVPSDSGCLTIDQYFEKVVRDGFEERKRNVWQPMHDVGELKYSFDDYEARIARELGIIEKMGYGGYFLIVWEFINYAIKEGIPVGPGRGSAAGSLVAYCMGITDVDPMQYELLFERFLNPERISMPDIDIDFCVRGRAQVINHVTEFYGRESVCQIITFGTMASKAAIKDTGRALNMPYGDVEKIAKLIPPPVRGRNVGISQALAQVPELAALMQTEPNVKRLLDIALKLEGCSRHTSVHAAGVVISPKPLHEIVPVALSGKNELTSQYTMGDLEKVGMLKMDFLALTTLTVIADCLDRIKKRLGVEIDFRKISLKDEKAMQIFGDGKTEAIFQFESSGMQEITRRLKPKTLEDLAALNALYRPGPLDGGMVDDFIARHRREKKVEYIVPKWKRSLKIRLEYWSIRNRSCSLHSGLRAIHSAKLI